MIIRNLFFAFLNIKQPPPNSAILMEPAPVDVDEKHRIELVGIVMILFIALTGFFCIQSYLKNNLIAASVLATLFAMNIYAMRKHHVENAYALSQWTAGLTLFCLFFHCLLNNGAHSISVLWGLGIISCSFYILGRKWGSVFTLAILTVMFLLFNRLMNENIMNTFLITDIDTFAHRFIGALAFIAFLALLQELDRSRMIKNLLKSQEQLRQLASTDELTGLANRRTMAAQLCQQERRLNHKGDKYSIILCDIDHFKMINDTYGHDAGDKVISEVAALLKENLRESDTVARWGGEEFLIMLPHTNLTTASQITLKLQALFDRHYIKYASSTIHATLSFGVASADANTYADECIRLADRRLYKAKACGRNSVAYAD